MIAQDPRISWDYILVEDRALPADKRTVFHLAPLTLADEQALLDDIHQTPDGQFVTRDVGSRQLRSLRRGLRGWDNMFDASGGAVESRTKDGVITDESLGRLSLRRRVELANAIENGTRPTTDELGK